MIRAPFSNAWIAALVRDVDKAAAEVQPPSADAHTAPDPRRLAIFADALDVFSARQPKQMALLLSSIRREYDAYLRGPRPARLGPIDHDVVDKNKSPKVRQSQGRQGRQGAESGNGNSHGASASPDGTSSSGTAASTLAAVRSEIADLQERIKQLNAELASADKEHRRAAAKLADNDIKGANGCGPEGNEESEMKTRSKAAGSVIDVVGATHGLVAIVASRGVKVIPEAVVRIGQLDAETATLEAQCSKEGVPPAVIEWLQGSLTDVTRERRVVQKQLEILDKGWFASELAELGGGGVYGAMSTGEGWFETTSFA
jgi:hypothetical protein